MIRATADVLLTDCGIDRDHVAVPLIEDGVHGDGRLAGLAVADDKLTLAAPERDHGIDHRKAGGERLGDEVPIDDGRGRPLDRVEALRFDRVASVQRTTKRV